MHCILGVGRTAIVRALIHDPPLLLMDEPFGALDALTREQMRIDLEALWLARPKTVIFVTHSVMESAYLSDRVLVMSPRPGCIVAEIALPGGPRDRLSPAFAEGQARVARALLTAA